MGGELLKKMNGDWTGSQTNKLNKAYLTSAPVATHTEFGCEQYTHRFATNCMHVAERSLAVTVGVLCSAAALIHTAASASPSRSNLSTLSFWPLHLVTVQDHGTRPTLSSAVAAAAAPDGAILQLNTALGRRRTRNTALPSGTLFPFFGDKPTNRQNPVFFFALLPWGSLNLMQKPSYLPDYHSARTTEEEQQSTRDSCFDRYRSLCLFFGSGLLPLVLWADLLPLT
ncbi:hypothetical protein EDB87DRAFT_1250264 [Lactarius vividus]|nr:hypothetical protein EDB87DRAFT_1250264 [Lactarius vividus]